MKRAAVLTKVGVLLGLLAQLVLNTRAALRLPGRFMELRDNLRGVDDPIASLDRASLQGELPASLLVDFELAFYVLLLTLALALAAASCELTNYVRNRKLGGGQSTETGRKRV